MAKKQQVRASLWNAQADLTQHVICIAALLAVALVFYAPALFSGKTLIGGDIVQWRATAESMLQHRADTGEEPLWATNVFGGMPGYVISPPDKVLQIDVVPTKLRAFAWPVSHFIFLLLGAYLLVLFLTRDKLASTLAAAAYGLTTYLPIILTAGHNSKFIALCFAPWLLLAFANTLRRPAVLSGLLFAIALAVHLRAGHVQITYYITFLIGVWWVFEGVGAIREGRAKQFGMATLLLALGAVAALGMAAQSYLLTTEYRPFSIRGSSSGGVVGGLDWNYAMGWSQGIGELVTLLIADAYGGAAMYWGPKPPTGGPHYVGGIVLLLAAVAVWHFPRRVVGAFGIAAGLMTLFSLGRHFEALNRLMYEYFPLFDAFRVPETWLITVALSLAVLAGIGLAYIVRPEESTDAEKDKTRAILRASATAVFVVLILLLGRNALFSFERPNEFEEIRAMVAAQMERPVDDIQVVRTTDQLYQERLVTPRADAFTKDAVRTLLFLLLAGGALFLFRRKKLPAWSMQVILVLLVAIDLGGVGRRYFSEDHLSPTRRAEARIPTLDVDRFVLEQQAGAGGAGSFRVLSLERMDQTRNARPSFHHESLGGYSGAKLRRYQDFLEHMLRDPETGHPNENALDMLNTRFVIAQNPTIPGTNLVYQGDQSGLNVLENPDVLSRAYFVGETDVIEAAEDTWTYLRSPEFDPQREAILAEEADLVDAPIDSTSSVSVELIEYGPRKIAWSAETDRQRLLVISEMFYPVGWTAFIDESEVPIHRANYLLRSVVVPEGAHEVTLRFDPRSYRLGRVLSSASTALVYGAILLLIALAILRRRRS